MTTTMNPSSYEIRQERHQAYETIEAMTAAFSRSVEMNDIDRLKVMGGVVLGRIVLLGEPGEGKTLIAKTFATITGGTFGRHQGTADAMPSDITGMGIFNQETRKMEFDRGPVLKSNYYLADEVNRNPPRTQSALLEVMEEGQVSFRGQAVKALSPMTFIATMNPVDEEQGTYPLPLALIDRFDCSVTPAYSEQNERAILERSLNKRGGSSEVASLSQVAGMRSALDKINVSSDMIDEILEFKSLIKRTEGVDLKRSIIGNRVVHSVGKLARFHALTRGKEVENVNREDIAFGNAMAYPHRLRMKTEYARQGYQPSLVVEQAIKAAA